MVTGQTLQVSKVKYFRKTTSPGILSNFQKRWIIALVGFFVFLNPSYAQLSNQDKAEISKAAQQSIKRLETMLNYLADTSNDVDKRDEVAQSSFNSTNKNKIFTSPKVRIEDDTNPRNLVSPAGAPPPISTYLNRVKIFFKANANTTSPIRFTDVQVMEVGSKAYVYAQVFYVSKFEGAYMPDPSIKYSRTSRIGDIIAEKANGKWVTSIQNISFATQADIVAMLGDGDAPRLFDRIEDVRNQLEEDEKLIVELISILQKEINTFRAGADQTHKTVMDDNTYSEALETLMEADSLASTSLKQFNDANLHLGLAKINVNSVDSLINISNSHLREVSSFSKKGAEERIKIKNASSNIEQQRADGELASSIAKSLCDLVNEHPDTTLEQKFIMYKKALFATKEVDNSAKKIEKEKKNIEDMLEKLIEQNRKSYSSLQNANQQNKGAENAVKKAYTEKEKALDARSRGEFLVTASDSSIRYVERRIMPWEHQTTKRKTEAENLVKFIDEQLEDLRARQRDLEIRQNELKEAENSQNSKIISEVEKLNLMAEQLNKKINLAYPNINNEKSYAQTESDKNVDEKLNNLLDKKLKAMATIAEVRRAKQRTAYSSQNVFKQIDQKKDVIERAQSTLNKTGQAQKKLNQMVTDSRGSQANAEQAMQAAEANKKKTNRNVDKAFKTVKRKTLSERRHVTPYVGLNYQVFQSSHLNINNSPVFNTHGDNQFGNLGLSVYYIVGGFAEGFHKVKSPYIITDKQFYTREFLINKQREPDSKPEFVTFADRYDESNFVESGANLWYYKYGIYVSPINNLYLKLGVSNVRGTVWNIYKGSFPENEVDTFSPGLYAVDQDSVISSGFILGAAFVRPFYQAEVGYDMLLKDLFVSVGINIPLRKTFTLTRNNFQIEELIKEVTPK